MDDGVKRHWMHSEQPFNVILMHVSHLDYLVVLLLMLSST